MKKRYVLLSITILILFLSFNCLEVFADQKEYWDDFMDKAALNYDLHQSHLEFFTKIMEKNAGTTVNNGTDTELDFYFGIFKNTQLHIYLFSESDFTNVIGEVKHQFYEKNGLCISGMGRIYHEKDEFTTPSIKVLFDKVMSDRLTLHNNLQLFIWDSGIIGKRIENGINFKIDTRNFIQMRLKTYFDYDITLGTYDFRIAYKNIVNEQTNLIIYGYYEKDNVHMENIVEFWPIPPLELSVNATVNTGKGKNNWVIIRGEYSFSKNWMVEGEFHKELLKDGYRYLKMGFTFNI